jgi:betaine-aldehyde dehydrogenase
VSSNLNQMTRREHALQLAAANSRTNFVAGKFIALPAERCFPVVDPSTLREIGQAPDSDPAAVDAAVAAARAAFPAWAALTPHDRSRLLLAAATEIERQVDDLAALIALETGRPFRTETRPEAVNAVRILRYFAGLPMEAKGESFLYGPDVLALTVREPLGVVAAFVPWNVPATLFCLKVAPALATGNAVVVKPAEQSTLSTILLTRALAAVLPAGVLNVVGGRGRSTGRALATHRDVRKITFTGSVETGRSIYTAAAERLVPVTLELGGKSPLVIFPDVDLDEAVQLAIIGMRFSRQGQSCTSTTRILVHAAVRERFLARLREAVGALRIGDPLLDATDVGALVSRDQVARVERYVAAAEKAGLKVERLGAVPADGPLAAGCFLPPMLVLDPPMDSPVVQEEIFGPVATVHSWTGFDDVVAAANRTGFGLSACILTRDTGDALTLARRLEAGFIQVNSGLVVQPGISFGGYKLSGLGREASLDSMLEAFTQVKTILIDHHRSPPPA